MCRVRVGQPPAAGGSTSTVSAAVDSAALERAGLDDDSALGLHARLAAAPVQSDVTQVTLETILKDDSLGWDCSVWLDQVRSRSAGRLETCSRN